MSSKERLVNNGRSNLNGAITNSATIINVNDGSVFPPVGDFRVIVDQEIMLVTAVTVNALTVVRAQENTLAVAHNDGVVIAQILTKGALQRYLRDSVPMFDTPSETSNRLNIFENLAGTSLTVASFAWLNQGGATASDYESGGVYMFAPQNTGDSLRILTKSAPGTPYTLTAAIRFGLSADSATSVLSGDLCGIAFRENATSKISLIGVGGNATLTQQEYTDATTFSFTNAVQSWRFDGPIWLQLENDGTNLNFAYSIDGINWIQLYTELVADFFTTAPDELCMFINNSKNQADSQMSVLSWLEE